MQHLLMTIFLSPPQKPRSRNVYSHEPKTGVNEQLVIMVMLKGFIGRPNSVNKLRFAFVRKKLYYKS